MIEAAHLDHLPPPSPRWACGYHGLLESEGVFLSLYDVRCGRCAQPVISSDDSVTMAIRNDVHRCELETFARWRTGMEREKKAASPRGL